jgi:hypothetical protein
VFSQGSVNPKVLNFMLTVQFYAVEKNVSILDTPGGGSNVNIFLVA